MPPTFDSSYTDFNAFLPYATSPEPSLLLADIKSGLVHCLASGDLAPGAVFWVKSLNNYVDLRYPLSQSDRIDFANLFLTLCTEKTASLDFALIDVFANACVRMLKKQSLVPNDALTLQWKPIYDLLRYSFFPKQRERVLLGSAKFFDTIVRLICRVRRFFDPADTPAILAEIAPNFFPGALSQSLITQALLMLFLPTHACPPPLDTGILTMTRPSFYWIPSVFALWETIAHVQGYDAQWINLLSRLVYDNVHTPEHVNLTSTQIEQVFCAGLRILDIPLAGSAPKVSSNPEGANAYDTFQSGRNDKTESFAIFIIYSIYPGNLGYNHNVVKELGNLIQAIDSYFHPSNSGHWSITITKFVKNLAWALLKRLREEELPDCKTPPQLRLTKEIVHDVVSTLRNVAYLSMFGKDQISVMYTHQAIKYLIHIEPDMILPGLLERVYPALETLTETHRTVSSISTMSSTVGAWVKHPEGSKHVLPLLLMALPGIDMNDPMKTVTTLMFISNTLLHIPLWDLTTIPSNGDLSDAESMIKYSTSSVGDFVAGFLDRLFAMFQNLPEEHLKGNDGNAETNLLAMALHTCEVFFIQLSPEMHDLALSKIGQFVRTTIIPNATISVGFLVATAGGTSPKKSLKAFLPISADRILEELEHGAGSSMESNPLPGDSTLLWFITMAHNVVVQAGVDILLHKDLIVSLLKTLFSTLRNREIMKAAGKLLKHTLLSLVTVYPLEGRSVTPKAWADMTKTGKAWTLWGVAGDLDDLHIQWHVPNEAEIAFAVELVDQFLVTRLDDLSDLMQDVSNAATSKERGNVFMKHLVTLKACVAGISTMGSEVDLSAVDEPVIVDRMDIDAADDEDTDLFSQSKHKKRVLACGYVCVDPADPQTAKMRDVKLRIGAILNQAMNFFFTRREADVENTKIVVEIVGVFLTDRGVEKSKYDANNRALRYAKSVAKTVLDKKRYSRNTLVKRVYAQQLLRLKHNANTMPKLPVHDALIRTLLKLSMSRYTVVRKNAQFVLNKSLRCFGSMKYKLLPQILQTLQRNAEKIDPDVMKGALYLLSSRNFLNIVLRDWNYLEEFVSTLCLAEHEDKLSVQDLIKRLYVDWLINFTGIHLQQSVGDQAKALVQKLSLGLEIDHDLIKSQELKVLGRSVKNKQRYVATMATLVGHTKQILHWRFGAMTLSFLELLSTDEMPVSVEAAEAAIDGLISELPAIRRVSITLASRLLYLIKNRSLGIHGGGRRDMSESAAKHPMGKLRRVVRKATATITAESLAQSVLLGSSANSDLIEEPAVGWLVWPLEYTAYRFNTDTDTGALPYSDESSIDALRYMESRVCSVEFWTKLSTYMSLENSNRSGAEDFSKSASLLYKTFFQMFEDRFIHIFRPIVAIFAKATDQRSQQRCAAEMMAGLIRGTKNWSQIKRDSVWEWAIPLLEEVFERATPDTLVYWTQFVKHVTTKRDPRRVMPLINLIMKSRLNISSDSFFSETKNLFLKREIIQAFSWRLKVHFKQIIEEFSQNLRHPFKAVRELMGSILCEISQQQAFLGFETVSEFIHATTRSKGLVLYGDKDDFLAQSVKDSLEKMAIWRAEGKERKVNAGSTDYGNASKTLLVWAFEAFNGYRQMGTYAYMLPMIHEFFMMLEFDEQELQAMSSQILSLYSQLPHPISLLPMTFTRLLSILSLPEVKWQVRVRALPVIQVLAFKHLHILDKDAMATVMTAVSKLLTDPQVEVRHFASSSLSGLIRCSQRESIEALKAQFQSSVMQKLPPRPKKVPLSLSVPSTPTTPLSAASSSNQTEVEKVYADALLQRHAGVLLGSCLVLAFPYEVPKWMPDVLVKLAKCISDPAPIQTTVKSAFAEWKRTHQDTWIEDKKNFTEDQLYTLSDLLVSPSYYA